MKDNCSEVTLCEFIRCLFHQEYTILATDNEGFEKCHKQWNAIYEEYCGLTGNNQYTKLLKCLNEIIRLQKILYHSRVALTVLTYKYSESDINILKQVGFACNFDKNDKESYIKDLENVSLKLKGFKMQLEIQEKKLLDLQKYDVKPQTESDFMEGVAAVGKSHGFHILIKQTSLIEWAGMVKLHNKMCENGK